MPGIELNEQIFSLFGDQECSLKSLPCNLNEFIVPDAEMFVGEKVLVRQACCKQARVVGLHKQDQCGPN